MTTPIPGAAAADAAAKANNALWYAFYNLGRAYLIRRGSLAASDADASFIHGYPTIEQAIQNPNTNSPTTQLTISAWNVWASSPVGGGEVGVIETVNVTAPTKSGGTPTVSTQQNPTTAEAIQAPGDIVGALTKFLTQSSIWLRGAEIVAGLMLIYLGIKAATQGTAVGNVARQAKKTAKTPAKTAFKIVKKVVK